MKFLRVLIFIFLPCVVSGQRLTSGEYDSGLSLAYDSTTGLVTGYFDESSGWDESTQKPQFSCTFYLTGVLNDSVISINTWYPGDDERISGSLHVTDPSHLNIQLQSEHGGCWNVRHFADSLVSFELQATKNWLQIRYIDVDKSYFYRNSNKNEKLKSYLVRGDIMFVHKKTDGWVYCTYYAKKKITGWIRLQDLNGI